MKILVIEDSRLLRGVYERTLTRAGYEVIAVADGEEGIRKARLMIPSLILLDMMLPGLDGPAVLKTLKEDELTAQIPVVVLTGLSQRNEAKLKQAGAAAYIEKGALGLEKSADGLARIIAATLGRASGDCGAQSEENNQGKDNSEEATAIPGHSLP